MPAKENLLGKKFNRLLVIDTALSKNKKTYWKCKCDCGTILEVRADQLKSGNTKSCGCLNTETRSKLGKTHIQDITNQKFGYLTALQNLGYRPSSARGYVWQCICDCGNIVETSISDLHSGNTSSCGCAKESIGEKNIGLLLLNSRIQFETQKTFPNLFNKQGNRHLKFDFFIPNLNILIEFDGPQHYTTTTKYTTEQSLTNDQIKNQWCLSNNIKLYRIPYSEKDSILKCNSIFELLKEEYLVQRIDHYNMGLRV